MDRITKNNHLSHIELQDGNREVHPKTDKHVYETSFGTIKESMWYIGDIYFIYFRATSAE